MPMPPLASRQARSYTPRIMLARLLATLGRRAPLILALGIFIGLASPGLAAYARPLLTPSVFAMLVVTMLRIDWPKVIEHARRPGRLGLVQGWVLIGCPLLMMLLVAPLDLPPGLKAAMVLYAAAPPLLTAPAIAVFSGLDSALALIAVVAAMFLYPIVLPPLALALLGIDLEVGTADLMLRLAGLIVGAFLLAMAIQKLAGKPRIKALSFHLDGMLVVLMIIFAIAAMDGVAARAIAEPGFVLMFVLASFAVNLGLQALSLLVFFPLPRITRTTIALITGNRNFALLMAALGTSADPDIFLYFAIGQLPIYLLPVVLQPVYRRLAGTQIQAPPSDTKIS